VGEFSKRRLLHQKIKRLESSAIGKMWEELIFVTIGELFEDPDVVGIVLSIRKSEDVIFSIWNKSNSNSALRFKIGEKLKEVWELDPHTLIEYKNHSNSMKDKNTYHSNVKQLYI